MTSLWHQQYREAKGNKLSQSTSCRSPSSGERASSCYCAESNSGAWEMNSQGTGVLQAWSRSSSSFILMEGRLGGGKSLPYVIPWKWSKFSCCCVFLIIFPLFLKEGRGRARRELVRLILIRQGATVISMRTEDQDFFTMLPCLFHHPSKAWWWDPSRIFLSVNFKFTLDRKTATSSPTTWPFQAHLPGHSSWETIRRTTCWNLLREIFALPSDRNRTGLESTLTPPWKRAGPERIFSCQWCGELNSLANYEGLNVCATSPQIPEFICWNPNSQYDDIVWWALGDNQI